MRALILARSTTLRANGGGLRASRLTHHFCNSLPAIPPALAFSWKVHRENWAGFSRHADRRPSGAAALYLSARDSSRVSNRVIRSPRTPISARSSSRRSAISLRTSVRRPPTSRWTSVRRDAPLSMPRRAPLSAPIERNYRRSPRSLIEAALSRTSGTAEFGDDRPFPTAARLRGQLSGSSVVRTQEPLGIRVPIAATLDFADTRIRIGA